MKSSRTSALEEALAIQIKAAGLPEPQREVRFHPTRKWKLDFFFPDQKLGVEVEGGTWVGGRHVRGVGFSKDCEKYAEAMLLQIDVLRVTGEHVRSGEAIRWLSDLMRRRGWKP